jgi:hypothetical protein
MKQVPSLEEVDYAASDAAGKPAFAGGRIGHATPSHSTMATAHTPNSPWGP